MEINEKIDNKILNILIFIIFLTSSFDIFLSFDIGGFTFRISQLLCIVLFFYYIVVTFKTGKIYKPVGIRNLSMWVFIVLMFTFNTVLPSVNIGYHLWLIFNVIVIFAMTCVINKKENLYKILKLYILSFFIVALIGILEFIIGVLGIDFPYITQWWIKGKVPRVNGFSFEPSYYATYLLIGWTLCRELVKRKENSKELNINLTVITLTITLAIILSSSRIGIALMVAYEGIIFLKNIFSKKRIKYVVIMTLLITIGIFVIIALMQIYDFSILLSGTGLNGSSSHSVSEREENLNNVIQVFKQSPILGRGLGGIYAQIALNENLDLDNINVQDDATAICVFAEVLAASGIIGFYFFIRYILDIILKPIKLSKKCNKILDKKILISMVMSLIMELIILQFNQNILRPYLWIHIAMISVCYRNFKKDEKGEE